MNKPTKTPHDQMPDKVRLLVDYKRFRDKAVLTRGLFAPGGSAYEGYDEWGVVVGVEIAEMDLLLQAGWAEPVEKKTRLARVKKWEKYWYVNYEGKVANTSEDHAPFDDKMYELGNYVHTKAQAERASKAMHEKLMELQKEFAEEARG